ncbi:MAG: transcriptional repressor [Elusimicrobia bacterium]|nr:transcriptional repressor [Elusimicrobiota bacterium]MBU2614273.1 transcriptional repressor [Elusimicrobiota bacterium]
MEKVKKLLESKGIRPTYQRLKILKYLEDNKEHPTVDIIYEVMKKDIPTISKTTVYNTLNSLIENGVALPIIITGKETRFDSNVMSHHHFYCEKCGKILDLKVECEHFKKGNIQGHKIKELHGYYKGICKNCL